MSEDKSDKNVHVISGKDDTDPDFFDDVPQTYAYIVKGVRYKGEWYYEKSSVTYFEADNLEEGRQMFFNSLQGWSFFKENSTAFNPDFWETDQFSKVEDLTKHPDWDKYKDNMWKSREIQDRSYIGMYEIVADEIKRKKSLQNEKFESEISSKVFIPYYEKQVKRNSETFSEYGTMYDKLSFIYPKERGMVLNPVMVTNSKGEKTLRYFFTFPEKQVVYEWTYFKIKELPEKTWHYGSAIIDQLNTVTDWDFSYDTLDDADFWNKYVIEKSENSYKYLKRVSQQ